MAIVLILYTIWLFVTDFLRKRWKKFDEWLIEHSLERKVPDRIKWYSMIFLSIACIFLYAYCWMCRYYGWGGLGEDKEFLDRIYGDLLGILPWIVWGCLLAGIMNKYLHTGRLRFPNSMFLAGILGALDPLCTCGTIPMAHALMLGKRIRFRVVLTFLIVSPVLSPIVFILALSQIGWEYLLTEVISVFVLAFVMSIIIERVAGVKESTGASKACVSCKGCRTSHLTRHQSSAILTAWDQLLYLQKYIFLGIIIGGLMATQVEPSTISDLFGDEEGVLMGLPGLVLIVSIGIPLFICSGEDVIILAPMIEAGLPMGHAVAFAITGNAICIAAAPLLLATFGRRVTVLMFAGYFFGGIIVGLIVNMIFSLI